MNIKSTFTAAFIFTLSQSAFASFDIDAAIKLVNHYPGALEFAVKTINPDNSSLPEKFTLQPGDAIDGAIIDKGSDGRPVQEVFFRVSEVLADTTDHQGFHSAFWGSYISSGKLVVHKYDHYPYQYGIGYSWVEGKGGEMIVTFCAENEFKKHGHC